MQPRPVRPPPSGYPHQQPQRPPIPQQPISGQQSTNPFPQRPPYPQQQQQQQQQNYQQFAQQPQQQYNIQQQQQPVPNAPQFYTQPFPQPNSPIPAAEGDEFIRNATAAAYPAAQIGLQFGSQAFTAGHEYMNKNIDKWVPKNALKNYFNVTNGYVLHKLALILYPFGHKSWQRDYIRLSTSDQTEGFKPPREDINSPDLYIPTMAIVTYVLLTGFATGLKSRFHPDILGITATTATIFILMELLLVKLGCYILSITSDASPTILDILAMIGYNYVGLIVTALIDLATGGSKYFKYPVFLYVSLAMAFFMLRSLRQAFLPEASSTLVGPQRRRRIQFLFGIAVFQIILSYFLLV